MAASAPQATGSVPVRLTRRGRLVLLAVFVAVAFVVLTLLGGESAATRDSGVPVETTLVQVGEGDTLWGIAASVAEPGETREMVYRIQELNALSDGGVVVGQELAVPVE